MERKPVTASATTMRADPYIRSHVSRTTLEEAWCLEKVSTKRDAMDG